MTLGSLFDGVGVFPLSASRHGIKPVWASEIEKAPISITKRHFPEMEHVGDLTRIHGRDLPPAEVITFGSPCQNLSSIGFREGLQGKASSLFFEAIRIIREMREATNNRYPTFALWENVVGATFSANGFDYRAVLEAFSNREIPMPASGKWANAGMVFGGSPNLAWRLLDSQFHYCAQRRRRIFVLADYGGTRTAKILFDPTPLHQILTVRSAGKNQIPAQIGSGACEAGRPATKIPEVWFLQGRKMRGAVQHTDPRQFHSAVNGPDGPCPTLLAGDAQNMIILYPDAPEQDVVRRMTPAEYERAMGLPDGWTALGHDGKQISDSARYKAIGNSIAVPCAEFIMHGIAKALRRDSLESGQSSI